MFSHVNCVCVCAMSECARFFFIFFFSLFMSFSSCVAIDIDMFIQNAQNILASLYYKIGDGNWECFSLSLSLDIPSPYLPSIYSISIHHKILQVFFTLFILLLYFKCSPPHPTGTIFSGSLYFFLSHSPSLSISHLCVLSFLF